MAIKGQYSYYDGNGFNGFNGVGYTYGGQSFGGGHQLVSYDVTVSNSPVATGKIGFEVSGNFGPLGGDSDFSYNIEIGETVGGASASFVGFSGGVQISSLDGPRVRTHSQ